jgi:signal peptidase II
LTKLKGYLLLLGISGSVVAMDQWSKYLVRANLQVGESWMPISALEPHIRIIHWNNTGAAFGILPSGGLVFTVVAVIVTIAIFYYYPRVPQNQAALRFALALQLGGAIGNLTDRLLQGTVTDFVAVGRFPVFNVADASISVGVTVLLISMFLEQPEEPEEQLPEMEEAVGIEEEA